MNVKRCLRREKERERERTHYASQSQDSRRSKQHTYIRTSKLNFISNFKTIIQFLKLNI